MHPTRSLVDGTFADALGDLAERYARRRSGEKSASEKAAAPSWLSSLGETVAGDPIARNALLGTAIGGVAGAGSHMINPEHKRERRGLWRNLARGALTGAALGGGAGLAQKSFTKGTPRPDAGVFTDPTTGKKMRIDPKVLAKNPGLLKEIQDLSDPGSLVDQGIYGAVNAAGAFMYNNLPISSVALPAMGIRDLYYNSRWLPKGMGAAGRGVGAAGDWLTRQTGFSGGLNQLGRGLEYMGRGGLLDLDRAGDRAGLRHHADPAVTRRGLEALGDAKSSPQYAREKQLIQKILGRSDADRLLEVARIRDPAARQAAINRLDPDQQRLFRRGELSGRFRPPADPKMHAELTRLRKALDAAQRASGGRPNPQVDAAANELNTFLRNARRQQRVSLHGALLDEAAVKGIESTPTGAPAGSRPRVRIGPGGRLEAHAGGPWSSGRSLWRLGLVAGLPATEYTWNMLAGEASKERALRDRLKQYARPVDG